MSGERMVRPVRSGSSAHSMSRQKEISTPLAMRLARASSLQSQVTISDTMRPVSAQAKVGIGKAEAPKTWSQCQWVSAR